MLLTDRYAEALTYAAAAHAGQTRKGTSIPYISHPLAVSALVIENGGSETQAIAALLHDVLEDCGARHAPEIEARFGADVLRIVEGMTDGLADESGRKPEWRQRKLAYLDHLRTADIETVLVASCDKLHNATAIADDHAMIGEDVFARFSQPKPETVWYYRQLADILLQRLGPMHRVTMKFNRAVASWAGL